MNVAIAAVAVAVAVATDWSVGTSPLLSYLPLCLGSMGSS